MLLSKRFSTANSGGFINGILDRIRIDHIEKADGERIPAAPLVAPPSHEEFAMPSADSVPEAALDDTPAPELKPPEAAKPIVPKLKLPQYPLPKYDPLGEDD